MKNIKARIRESLTPIYPPEECESLAHIIIQKVLGYSPVQLFLNQQERVPAAKLAQIEEILTRLKQNEPIQYIFGETEFFGCPLAVNPSVLIPRPETEELVEWIIADYRGEKPTILDLGTGSGCIPIALAKNLPGATVRAWDISAEALDLARANALSNQVVVTFERHDLLSLETEHINGPFDLIVSNPPYVRRSEIARMHRNVTEFEPHLALFVPDEDPLIFYRVIIQLAKQTLSPTGNLYFEINEEFGHELTDWLAHEGFHTVQLRSDLQGKHRMIKAGR